MQIHCLTTFLDGRDRFEAGDTRTVDDARAARFIAAGWACVPGEQPAAPAAGAVTLDVQHSTHAQEARNG